MKFRGFYSSKNIQYDTRVVGPCHYTFFQTHGMYTSRLIPNQTVDSWVIIMYQ